MIEVQANIRRDGFSLDVDVSAAGQVITLFGRSGSGKTTAAGLVAGLIRPQRGLVRIDGETVLDTDQGIDVPAWRRRIGYVFQDLRLFPHLTVRGNLLYGARRRRLANPRLGEIVDLLALSHLLSRRPDALSGGEARRVAIGRALLGEPRLLILDEPLEGLDGARRAGLLHYLEQLAQNGPQILHITHSVEEAVRLSDEIVLVTDGKAFGAGPPTVAFVHPEAESAAGLNAPLSVLEGVAVGAPATAVDLGGALFHTPPLQSPPGSRVRIVVDARDVALTTDAKIRASFQNRLPVQVTSLEPHPAGVLVRLSGPGAMTALITPEAVEALGVAAGRPMVALVKATAAARYA